MLVRFSVENFLSFKNLTEFSMVAGKMTRHSGHIAVCNHKRLLKGAFIFGANASGKTNLIRAISFARNIVLNGIERTNCDKKFFRIDEDCKDNPGVFQFDIFSQGHFYSYGFAISYAAAVEEEWLYQIDNPNKEFCVFLRSKQENDETFTISSDIQFKDGRQEARFSVYKDDISSSKMKQTLFLRDIAMRSPEDSPEYQPFRDVMKWFERLVVVFPNSKYGRITQLLENDNEKTRLENLLNYFDTGIISVSEKEVEFDKAFSMLPNEVIDSLKTDIAKNLEESGQNAFVQQDASLIEIKNVNGELLTYEVVSNHGNDTDLFEHSDESDGTQRLFDLIPLFQKLLLNAVVLIDEVDRSLHTKAVQEFINYFYSLTEQNASQLIVTTHDSNIMNLDFVRQDEVWFIERQKDHSSKLYSLNKFMARFDKKVEKDYLLGRYGAIPIFRQVALEPGALEEGEQSAEGS